uniref:Uncharacterized protein n=1 Tax=Astyanax mexicanus TaxID=7994 RepID=A0A3B1IQX6_ASTMX
GSIPIRLSKKSKKNEHVPNINLVQQNQKIPSRKKVNRLGAVAHACNPSTLGGQDQPGQHGETPSLLKIQKLAGRGGLRPVVPATWEAEARETPRQAAVQP